MKVKFILREPKSVSETLVYCSLNAGYKKFKFSTNLSLLPKDWNPKAQEVRKSNILYAELNHALKQRGDALLKAFMDIQEKKIPITNESLKTAYLKNAFPNQPGEERATKTLIEIAELLIEESIGGERLHNGNKISAATVMCYKTTINHLKGFEAARKTTIFPESIDLKFYEALVNYFYHRNHSKNSTGKHIKNIKVFAQYAHDSGFPVCSDVFSKKFRVLDELTDQVVLNQDELIKIEEIPLPPRLDHARDIFLLACYTGLRYSDLKTLSPEDFSDLTVRVRTQKTNKIVIIPIKPRLKPLLAKYKDGVPYMISNQKLNVYIKEVCQRAGISQSVKTMKTVAGKKRGTSTEKFKLITMHTARRTFATTLYLAGMDLLTIMALTGHKSAKSFLKYIRVSEEEFAIKAAKHEFFQ